MEMDNEGKFLEKLNGIKELARTQNSRITTDEVEQYFSGESLTKEQIELVYDYLLAQKIAVVGYMKVGRNEEQEESQAGGNRTGEAAANGSIGGGKEAAGEQKKSALTAEEEVYLKNYENELSAILPGTADEKTELFRHAAEGDALAKSRLIELYLSKVLAIARELHDGTVFLGDMVQEGNVSLLLALDLISDADQADEMICAEIRQGIQLLLEEQTELKRQDNKMVHRVNELDDTIQNMKKDKGREITIEELAEYMKISEEEILDIIKLAGEDLKDREAESGEQ